MLAGLLDRFRRPKPDPEDVARVRGWVVAALGLREGDQVTISEIECADPACPGLETVVLVMRAGEKTKAVKIAGSLVTITQPMVAKSFTG